jgi:YHS domain-containing protein
MKPEYIKCECCSEEILAEKCEFATHSTIIEGKEYFFCCKNCATEYEKKKIK